MNELRFWFWHRWFGHGDGPFDVTEATTRTGRPVVQWRECLRCGRVPPKDVLDALGAFLTDLDDKEEPDGND